MTNREVFAFAGLWDVWREPKSRIKFVTVCLITTEANQIVEPVHDRMPVILDERCYELWLSIKKPPIEKLKECLQPYPANKMES